MSLIAYVLDADSGRYADALTSCTRSVQYWAIYQTAHLCCGFILLPSGQLYALANSTEFDTEPITLHNTTPHVYSLVKLLKTKTNEYGEVTSRNLFGLSVLFGIFILKCPK